MGTSFAVKRGMEVAGRHENGSLMGLDLKRYNLYLLYNMPNRAADATERRILSGAVAKRVQPGVAVAGSAAAIAASGDGSRVQSE
jgi:hypothetical protein